MIIFLVGLFVVGYALIALEHWIKVEKAAIAIFTGIGMWLGIAARNIFTPATIPVEEEILHHMAEIASILFFLMGAMVIVEIVDSYEGFRYLIRLLHSRSILRVLIYITILTFFLSAVLDNLTTTIVMISILRKLIREKSQRWIAASLVVLAANSGGAWSPLGDVTTTMLWIQNRITEIQIVKETIIPSLVSTLVPLMWTLRRMRGTQLSAVEGEETAIPSAISRAVFFLGIGGLVSVPVIKILFHVPPMIAMLFVMSLLWIVTEVLYRRLRRNSWIDIEEEKLTQLRVTHALRVIDTPSLLFFLGILLAVDGLSSLGLLSKIARNLDQVLPDRHWIVYIMGILSAIVDNVPLVAAMMNMYSLEQFPTDHEFWAFMAYCAGVGGNLLIIGSAAGVAAMGMEKIEFFWYLRQITFIAFIGYSLGALTYVLMNV
ncbi:MAG: sodium:proton antiporter NhaD [Bacteroidia bacterium]